MLPYIRSHIRSMAGYTPGEQPRDNAYIKLNTNENPYPPSPRVVEALQASLSGDRLRRYPDPLGASFRQAAGRVLGIDPDSILIGNGSDDILTIVIRALVSDGGQVVAPTPSYPLYRTLAEIQGARFLTVPFTEDWALPQPWPASQAAVTLLPNPNSPSGTMLPLTAVRQLAENLSGPLVLDEAYVDFADAHGLHLEQRRNIIITRSFSKSYALAGIRFGFAIADPAMIREFIKVKDSYNCDVLSLIAAEAAIQDQDYLQSQRAKILTTRERLRQELLRLGFQVCPSQANFVWCRHKDRSLRPIYEELKRRQILVRYIQYEGYGDGLRISVGTDAEIDRLLEELKGMV